MKKKIAITGIGAFALALMLLVATSPPIQAQPKFVLATWSFPDSYGQGISTWYAQSNRTGTWTTIEASGYLDVDPSPVTWNESQAMRVLIWCSLNYTLTGVSTITEGRNYIRHAITVYDFDDDVVFTQQNFTYVQGIENEGLYWYQYSVILDFLPLAGEYYTVEIMYEVYY